MRIFAGGRLLRGRRRGRPSIFKWWLTLWLGAPLLALALAASGAHSLTAQGGARSLREWAACDGKTDDARAVGDAFAAAHDGAFTLIVDCPAFIHVGMDIARPIFIDNRTTVRFRPGGLFITDNVLIPSFVIADSSDINLLGWRVRYVGGAPVDMHVDGFYEDGVFVRHPGISPSGIANDVTITRWLTANRGVIFQKRTAVWASPTNTSAIFYITGSASRVVVKDMKVFAPESAPGSQFAPTVFVSVANWKPHQTVTAATPITSDYAAAPNNLVFANIDLDGYYMGWQGTFDGATFTHIRAHRYGDLQDSNGENVGGVGCAEDPRTCWYAPPHLIYINQQGYPGIETRNVTIKDVIDYGVRVGTARNTKSGNLMSLKIGGKNVVVDRYTTYRPDGVADILNCDGLRITNLTGHYNSAYDDNKYPGIRFPDKDYQNVVMQNIFLTDSNPLTAVKPIGDIVTAGNFTMQKAKSVITAWAGPGDRPPQPVIRSKLNDHNKVEVTYSIGSAAEGPAPAK